MSFRLVLNSVTLSDLEWRNGPYFALFHVFLPNSVAFGAHCVKWWKIYLNFVRQKCSTNHLVFSDISLTVIP